VSISCEKGCDGLIFCRVLPKWAASLNRKRVCRQLGRTISEWIFPAIFADLGRAHLQLHKDNPRIVGSVDWVTLHYRATVQQVGVARIGNS